MPPQVQEARSIGWQAARLVADKLEQSDAKMFPGIRAWTADFDLAAGRIGPEGSPDRFSTLRIEALVTQNPRFWAAFYETAPGDPLLMIGYAGMLLSAGEGQRASYLLVAARQRPGIPEAIRNAMNTLLVHGQKMGEPSNLLVQEGIGLHDAGRYEAALDRYRSALALWPQNGWAHYEIGLTLVSRLELKTGGKATPPDTAVVAANTGRKNPPEVVAAFAAARRHDPLQIAAYQGSDPDVIRGFMALGKQGKPAWDRLAQTREPVVEDQWIHQAAAAFQEAGIHDLALVLRQVLVARRGSYRPEDHPFIAASLRKLAPGKETEAVLKRLAGGRLAVRQLVAPLPQ
jgi:tetratricopeptide (TPR) repeat protein